MTTEAVKFVTPTEAATGCRKPIRVWMSGGGTKTIDDFLCGKVLKATDDVLSYKDSSGTVSTFKISEGDRFEVLSENAVT